MFCVCTNECKVIYDDVFPILSNLLHIYEGKTIIYLNCTTFIAAMQSTDGDEGWEWGSIVKNGTI